MGAFLSTTSLIYIHLCVSSAIRIRHINHSHTPFPWMVGPGWDWILPNDPALELRKVTAECVTTMKNATFNLLPLHLSSKFEGQLSYYSVKDERSVSDPTDDYKYAFNICGPVLTIPDGCADAAGNYCEDNGFTTDKSDSICINQDDYGNCTQYCPEESWKQVGNNKVYAYQIKLDEEGQAEECWHLSDKDGGPGVWSLINEDNPSEGVVVSYLDGDYASECKHNRQVNIHFVCDNDHGAYGIPGKSSSEMDYKLTTGEEEEICQYKMEFHTIYGCPSQCPIVGNKLCNGVGLCGYDWSVHAPRCYCYSMWTGDSCTEVDIENIFKPKRDPVTSDSDPIFVKSFEHKLKGPSRAVHSVKVTYDLVEFNTEASKPYIMNDIDGVVNTYVWNFMGDIDTSVVEPFSEGTLKGQSMEDLGCPSDGAYIYQLNPVTGKCVIAGGKSNVTWTLYDEDNPAKGVVLNFEDGDDCDGTQNRTFRISLICPDDNNVYIPLDDDANRIFDAYVEEDDSTRCNYHVSIESAFACPDECITDATNTARTDDVSVCSTQGMCASDPFSGYVHCLCDQGWTGDYCDVVYVAPAPPVMYKHQGSYVAAICIISVVLVVVCWFGYKRIRSQRDKVKELQIKLVNYQSSGGGGGAAFSQDDPKGPVNEVMDPMGKQSLSQKIKRKLGNNKRGQYANINNEDEEEEELFNVKVNVNRGGHSDDSQEEENDDDAQYNNHPKQHYEIGDDEEEEVDSDEEEDNEERN